MSQQLRMGLVGLGYWGPNYARLLDGLIDGVTLAACVDLRDERLDLITSAHPKARPFHNHKEMLAAGEIDAVVVATGASAHRDVVIDCLEAGLPVLVEKPLADTAADAKAMVEAAERTGKLLMTGHTFMFNPAVRHVKKLIDSGELGSPSYLSFRRTGLGPIRSDVNALWDLAPHDLSMLRYWLGSDPIEVTARGQAYLREGNDDVVFLTLRYPGGVIAGIQVSWLDPVKDRTVTVVGDRKMIVFDDVHPTEKLRIYDKGVTYQPGGDGFAEFLASVRDGDIVIPKIQAGEPLREQVAHFVDCVRTGKPTISDGRVGLAIVETLEEAQADLAAATHEKKSVVPAQVNPASAPHEKNMVVPA